MLAALAFGLVVAFVAASASATRSGYAEMALLREIDGLRAETALFRFQIHLAESDLNVQEAALDLGMCPADPVQDVDYVLLPHPAEGSPRSQLACHPPVEDGPSLAARIAEYASGVTALGGQAEASTTHSHRP
jgi:hypothetical protein